jgi:hypothetical protein
VYLAVACDKPQAVPAAGSEPDLASAGLSDSALSAIRATARGPLGALQPLDSLGNVLPARGVAFALPQNQVAGTIARLRTRLGEDYLVFIADRGYGYRPDSIGIIRSDDPFDMLRVRSTSGPNYDIAADSVLALARLWDKEFGLELVGAGTDWFEARFLKRPTDFLALARVVYALCPDVVEQGTNTVAALAAEMAKTNTLFCWWD